MHGKVAEKRIKPGAVGTLSVTSDPTVEIVSKPRVWSPGAMAIWLESVFVF